MKLIDGDDLVDMVVQADAIDLVAKYSDHATYQKTSSSNTPSQERRSQQSADEEYTWIGLMILAAIPSTITALLIGILELSSDSFVGQIVTAIFLVAGTATAIGVYNDTLLVQRPRVSWHPNPRWWVIGVFLLPYLAVPFYLIRRYDELNT